jgi:RNA polymerase sigma-70 factor (ECF subfamily)
VESRDRDPDAALVRACQDPNDDAFEAAFEAIYRKYRDRAYAIAYRITGNSADAMDALQESFGLVFRKVGGFRFDSLFSTWLFRLVVNCSIDLVRSQQSRARPTSLSHLSQDAEPVARAVDPMGNALADEIGVRVHNALQKLSPKLRAILALRYLEELSYDELSKALALSMGTVKSRLARAHLALEQVLEPWRNAGLREPGREEGAA